MATKDIEKLYGTKLTGLLKRGLDWLASHCCAKYKSYREVDQYYDPTQSIIAAALQALSRKDIRTFTSIHQAENLSELQYPDMKYWLQEDFNFSRKVVAKVLTTLAELVAEEKLCPLSHFVTGVTGLEEKYHLCGVFVKAVLESAKRRWKVTKPEKRNASVQTSSEKAETAPEATDAINDKDAIPHPVQLDKAEMIKPLFQGRMNKDSVKSMLEIAVEREGADEVDTFLSLCGDVNEKRKNFSGLLHIAVKCKRAKVLSTLGRHGLDVQNLDEDGNAPLHLAAASNDFRLVKILTSFGAKASQRNGHGLLPMHMTDDSEIIVHLLENGTDVDARTPGGDTALHLAVSNGNREAIMVLLRYGASKLAMNSRGTTPEFVAYECRNPEVVNLLAEEIVSFKVNEDVPEPLQTVVEEEAEEGDKKDLNRKEEVKSTLPDMEPSRNPYTEGPQDGPLHKAAGDGQLQVVTELLDAGADIDAKGWRGNTALILASMAGSLEVAELLLQRGADINLANITNMTPLHYATHLGRFKMAKLLLEAGADPTITDKNFGMTPLVCAKGFHRIINMFKRMGIHE